MSKYSLIAFLFFSVILQSQTPFNKVFDFGYHQQFPTELIVLDSSIVVSGTSLRKNDNSERGMFAVQFNTDGEYINHTALIDDNDQYTFTHAARDIIQIGRKVFIPNHESAIGTVLDSAYSFIASYDLDGNSLEYHHIVKDSLNNLHLPWTTALSKTIDNNLVLLMSTGSKDNLGIWLQVLDPYRPNTVIEDFVFHKADSTFHSADLITYSDGYLIIGHYRIQSDPDLRGLFALSIDRDFNIVKEKYFDDQRYFSPYLNATRDREGNIAFVTKDYILLPNLPSFLATRFRALVTQLDENLDIVWQRPFGHHDYQEQGDTYTGIICSHDNDGYILCGSGSLDDDSFTSSIGKVGQDGDSLWLRQLVPLDEEIVASQLYDLCPTPDGHYMVTGYLRPAVAPDSVYLKGWLIKFDEDGHIFNIDSSSSVVRLTEKNLRVFPNPVSDILYIETDDILDATISILDNQGRIIVNEKSLKPSHTYMYPVYDLKDGVYFMRLHDSLGNLQIEKFIVQKTR